MHAAVAALAVVIRGARRVHDEYPYCAYREGLASGTIERDRVANEGCQGWSQSARSAIATRLRVDKPRCAARGTSPLLASLGLFE